MTCSIIGLVDRLGFASVELGELTRAACSSRRAAARGVGSSSKN